MTQCTCSICNTEVLTAISAHISPTVANRELAHQVREQQIMGAVAPSTVCENCFINDCTPCSTCNSIIPYTEAVEILRTVSTVNDTCGVSCLCSVCRYVECGVCAACTTTRLNTQLTPYTIHVNEDWTNTCHGTSTVQLCSGCSSVVGRHNQHITVSIENVGVVSVYKCRGCNELHTSGNTRRCSCNDSYCTDCYNLRPCCRPKQPVDYAKETRDTGKIHDYHPQIQWVHIKNPEEDSTRSTFFGIELEVECKLDIEGGRTSAAKRIATLLPTQSLCTKDASVSGGFEAIVTPHTMAAFKKLPFKALFDDLKVLCNEKMPSAGLHIHIEKKGWLAGTPAMLHQWGARHKLLHKFHLHLPRTNTELYQLFFNLFSREITKLSGRTPRQISDYCSFRYSKDRKNAVNISNTKTMEVRIWNSTLELKVFWSRIQFTFAVLEFLQSCSLVNIISLVNGGAHKNLATHALFEGLLGPLRQQFKQWLETKDQYQLLVQELRRLEIFDFKPLPPKVKIKPKRKRKTKNVRNSRKTTKHKITEDYTPLNVGS